MNYVIITGATGVIGKAFALNQIRQGENLVLVGRNEDKLNSLKAEFKSLFTTADVVTIKCDLSVSEDRLRAFSDMEKLGLVFKRLINVAGVDTQMPFSGYTQQKIRFQIEVNFSSVISLTKFALDHRADDFEVLTVSSMCGLTPMPYFALYSATKSALNDFFDGIRYEYKDVTFLTVMPGSVPTRPDVIEDIKKQGLTGKLSSKSPEYVVKKSLNALKKKKRKFIPGFYNKIVYFFTKITPYRIQAKIIASKFSKKQKDAF